MAPFYPSTCLGAGSVSGLSLEVGSRLLGPALRGSALWICANESIWSLQQKLCYKGNTKFLGDNHSVKVMIFFLETPGVSLTQCW